MKKTVCLLVTMLCFISISFSQKIDSLKLYDSQIPAGYLQSSKLLCKTVHAYSFYEQTDLYAAFLGNLVKKDFQSFEKKGDKGSILFFEFEKDFTGEAFLEGLLWGNAGKPTKQNSDEYLVKGRFLIIWSFNLDSELKKTSKEKIISILK
jgi:hypothetical protein